MMVTSKELKDTSIRKKIVFFSDSSWRFARTERARPVSCPAKEAATDWDLWEDQTPILSEKAWNLAKIVCLRVHVMMKIWLDVWKRLNRGKRVPNSKVNPLLLEEQRTDSKEVFPSLTVYTRRIDKNLTILERGCERAGPMQLNILSYRLKEVGLPRHVMWRSRLRYILAPWIKIRRSLNQREGWNMTNHTCVAPLFIETRKRIAL